MPSNYEITEFAVQARKQIERLAHGQSEIFEIPQIKEVLSLLQLAQQEREEQAWQSLIQAKSVLLQYFLESTQADNSAFRIKTPPIEKHIANEERRWKIEPPTTKQWTAHIVPSFDLSATITVKTNGIQSWGEFKVYLTLDFSSASRVETKFPPDWADPVGTILEGINLFDHSATGFVLDAIAYNLQITTPISETQVHFWNPVLNPFTDLEVAIWTVANMIMIANDGDDLRVHSEYLEIVRKNIYIRRNSR